MQTVNFGDVNLQFDDRGEGPPLLLVHGFPLDHTMWKYQLEGLSPHHRLITPDLRGFGASGVTDGTVTMEQFADDLNELLDATGAPDGLALCGLSMGGYIAFEFMRKYAPRVGALILCDTRAAPDDRQAAKDRQASADRVLEAGPAELVEALSPKLFAQRTLDERPGDVEAIRQTMLDTNPHGVAAALRGMGARADARKRLKTIKVPTLVIVGQHDAISPPDEMREIADAIDGGQFIEIPDAGHLAPLENPKAVNAAILEFLGGLA